MTWDKREDFNGLLLYYVADCGALGSATLMRATGENWIPRRWELSFNSQCITHYTLEDAAHVETFLSAAGAKLKSFLLREVTKL